MAIDVVLLESNAFTRVTRFIHRINSCHWFITSKSTQAKQLSRTANEMCRVAVLWAQRGERVCAKCMSSECDSMHRTYSRWCSTETEFHPIKLIARFRTRFSTPKYCFHHRSLSRFFSLFVFLVASNFLTCFRFVQSWALECNANIVMLFVRHSATIVCLNEWEKQKSAYFRFKHI